jgi:hypothetical protein
VQLKAQRSAVETGRRDSKKQRLPACAGSGLDHIPRVACLVRMHLIDDCPVHIQAIQRI